MDEFVLEKSVPGTTSVILCEKRRDMPKLHLQNPTNRSSEIRDCVKIIRGANNSRRRCNTQGSLDDHIVGFRVGCCCKFYIYAQANDYCCANILTAENSDCQLGKETEPPPKIPA